MCTKMIRVRGRIVPCGKCNECCRARANSAMQVIYDNGVRFGKGHFLTLTYAPEHTPFAVTQCLPYDEIEFKTKTARDKFFQARALHMASGRLLAKCRKQWQQDIPYDEQHTAVDFKGIKDDDGINYKSIAPVLTYYGKEYEYHQSLDREDIKKWLKRGRKALAIKYGGYENIPVFKYFCVGEYGPKCAHPHYHLDIFGLEQSDIDILVQDWKSHYGFVLDEPLDSGDSVARSAAYTSKYINKGVFEPIVVKTKNVQKPRVMCSQGMIYLSQREIDYYTGKDLGVDPNGLVFEDWQLDLIKDRQKRTVTGVQYKLSDKYKNKYFKREIVEYDCGEIKKRRINTPLQDALASFTQMRLAELCYREYGQMEAEIAAGEDPIETHLAFYCGKQIDNEGRRRLAYRKQKDAFIRSNF